MAVSKSTPSREVFEPDPRQREAIEHVHGPMLVVAGAGTGKTTVLTQRIAHLVQEGHARPDEIVALTYTVNAAKEMRERVRRELRGTSLSGLQAATFHDYCNRLLQDAGRGFRVLEDQDLWIFLRRRIRELRLNYFVRAADLGKFLSDLLDFLRRCQDELVTPEQYAAYVRQLERGEIPLPRVSKSRDAVELTDDEVIGRCREIAGVFSTVDRMLREANFGSFGHMITGAFELLRQDAARLASAQQSARFILVDEFQDANFAQVKVLQLLAGEGRNVFAVGDPDQAIYRFRGASSAAFELFRRQFPETRMVVLEKNRRSTTPILHCGFGLIAKNPEAFLTQDVVYQRSPLVSARDEQAMLEGGLGQRAPVEAVVWAGKDAECSDVITAIRERKRRFRCAWKDIAVLYRIHSHRDALAAALSEENIPFSIENLDVLDSAEVRDLLACLGTVVSIRDSAGLFRVAALPQFAVDPGQLCAGMQALSRDAAGGMASVLEKVPGGPVVLDTVRQARDEITGKQAKARAALEIVIRCFALNPASPALAAVLEFAREWENRPLTESGEIGEFLEYLEYFRQANGTINLLSSEEDGVRLMTVHSAKGLEWDHVFILRANSGSFPLRYRETLVEFPVDLSDPDSIAASEGKELNEQEERRLFYVAMTRARDTLSIYTRCSKRKDRMPDGFVRDLLKDPGTGSWLRQRDVRGTQLELAAEAEQEAEVAVPGPLSRTAEWLKRPPSSDLSRRLSATAIEMYETCPLQFKFDREWRIPREIPAAMQYGATIHRVLLAYYDSLRAKRELSENALIELFRTDLANVGIADRYQYELYEKQGLAQLRDFIAACQSAPPPEVLHTEEWFEVRIGGAAVAGRIDRMDRDPDGRVAITDYKTGKPRTQENADESLQLSIYAIAAREKWGYDPGRLVFYNLEENAPVTTQRDHLQLLEARRKVEEVAAGIQAGNFKPNPDYHCRFCPYRNLCPETERNLYRTTAGTGSTTPSCPS